MGHCRLKPAGFKELVLWLIGRRQRYRVSGWSMWPLFAPGDQVLLEPAGGSGVRAGEVVVFEHPARAGFWLIKQVEEVLAGGGLHVAGLNRAASTDSRAFGPVHPDRVAGKVSAVLR